jgi:hypothetical protein
MINTNAYKNISSNRAGPSKPGKQDVKTSANEFDVQEMPGNFFELFKIIFKRSLAYWQKKIRLKKYLAGSVFIDIMAI